MMVILKIIKIVVEVFRRRFLTPSVNFSTGANSGVITTPTIDYCDSNWVNCKN